MKLIKLSITLLIVTGLMSCASNQNMRDASNYKIPVNDFSRTVELLISNQQFLEDEIILRREKNLPPFARLIALIISSKNEKEGIFEAQKIKKNLSALKYLEIMGPVSSPIFKIKNNYRTRLLLRSKNNLFVQKHIAKILKKINLSKKIKLTVDVDPLNFS